MSNRAKTEACLWCGLSEASGAQLVERRTGKWECTDGAACQARIDGRIVAGSQSIQRVQRVDPALTGQTTSQQIRRVTRRDLLAGAPPLEPRHPGCRASCCIPAPEDRARLCADGTPASSWERRGATDPDGSST